MSEFLSELRVLSSDQTLFAHNRIGRHRLLYDGEAHGDASDGQQRKTNDEDCKRPDQPAIKVRLAARLRRLPRPSLRFDPRIVWERYLCGALRLRRRCHRVPLELDCDTQPRRLAPRIELDLARRGGQ